MNDTLKTIAERSSIRAYTAEKLTDEEIKILLNAGLQAPTARNMREVHISVVDGSNSILDEIDREKRELILKTASAEVKQTIMNSSDNFYRGAPTVFILSVDKDFKWNKLDAGIAAENISLAAQSMGLGSLIIGVIDDAMNGDKKDYFAKELKFPENNIFAIAVAVGHRNTEKTPHEFSFDNSVSFV